MTMPETTVDKADGPEPWEDDVRPTREPTIMEPVPEATGMKGTAESDFRFGVAAPYSRHHARPGLTVHYVGHGARSTPRSPSNAPRRDFSSGLVSGVSSLLGDSGTHGE